MTGQVVLILVCVVGGLIVVGVITQMLEGTGRAWRALAPHYPAQGAAPGATRGEAKIFMGEQTDRLHEQVGFRRGCMYLLMPWTWMRDSYQVRYAVDDEYLHLEIEGGRLARRGAMSIPWGAIEIGERFASEMGEHVSMRVGDTTILFPAVGIEREMELRAAGESQDAPGAEGGSGVQWSEDL